MNSSVGSSSGLSTWTCHAGDVPFRISAQPEWLSTQRAYLSDFLTTPPGERALAAFNIRVHTDDVTFRRVTEIIRRSPIIGIVEPVVGLLMQEARQATGRRYYVVATDNVEHKPGAYAVAAHGEDIDLFVHAGTGDAHRYPIRLIREAMLRTYEDAGGSIFHAAGVDVGGIAVMVCGPRGAGKTTVAAALLRSPGAALLSNDRVVVHQRDHVVAVPLPVPAARGTIHNFPELERLFHRRTACHSELERMPAEFGSVVKHSFTAREFAEAFDARLIARSKLRLVVIPRLTNTNEPTRARRLPMAAARRIIAASCFTPRDEFWVRPWLVPRRKTEEQLGSQASAAIEHLATTVPCIEMSFGVRNAVGDLVRSLENAMEGLQ
ncbi:hypothetical protein FHR81_002472 [Actinoalloteichus hoggarensis]|uniref:Uncharacterized protein n=1 Tax=Actinoalloteichus hoggarensis TaxID=1470176 RepID=A0A221VX40_9PSEU|nr:AAA family ATPase [Actinoalloteichus hoggarensis]ASO18075.1 hypothetical protein AHOG_02055 [Actinoalloteichus hoggarensis]MBB5921432.1 hypothetical protein [Actinoalloteichus hoggarensis]